MTYPVEWGPIDRVDRAHADETAQDQQGVFSQGFERGGAVFARGEGAWPGPDAIHFVATRSGETAGACYSPDGKWLFFNIQTPGITVTVTGPWAAARSSLLQWRFPWRLAPAPTGAGRPPRGHSFRRYPCRLRTST